MENKNPYWKFGYFWVKVVRKLFSSPGQEWFMKLIIRGSFGKIAWGCYSIIVSLFVVPFAFLVLLFGRLVITLRRLRPGDGRPSRVLYVSHESALNGAPISLYSLLRSLDREKYEPIVVTREIGPLNDMLERRGIKVEILPLSLLLRQRYDPVWTFYDLIMFCWGIPYTTLFLLAEDIDIVHTNVSSLPDFAFSARCIGLKNVWHFRETLMGGSWQRLQVSAVLAFAHKVVCISKYAASTLNNRGDNNKIEVIYNALYVDDFVDESGGRDFRDEFDIPEKAPAIGVIGQITPDKGQEFFVKAACIVHEQAPDAKFFIVGSLAHKKYVRNIKSVAWDLGLSRDALFFTGIRDDVPKIMQGLDIVVVPSVWQEMFGRVNIEAMYCRKPVVATTQGGIPEIVLHEKTGLLVPPEDEKALSEAILRLINNPEERKEFGEKGHKRLTENFSMELHASRIERCYADLLGWSDE